MADIGTVLNAYLVEAGYDWQPTLLVLETARDDYGLPIGRVKGQAARYEGTLRASFPTRSAYNSFLSFWATNRNATWTWTNPDDGVGYTCRFRGDRPGYRREGPEEFTVEFEAVGLLTPVPPP